MAADVSDFSRTQDAACIIMPHYLIDGFNLYHQIRVLEESKTPRSDLVQYIRRNKLTGSMNNRVTIVFDGYETAELNVDPDYHIVFSDSRTADDVIKEIIRGVRHKRDVLVVSDDNEIKNAAREEGAQVWGTDQFLANRKSRQSKRGDEEDRGLSPSQMMDITDEFKKIWDK
jgi:hypothetical protein